MEQKDPKDMTASELLRWAANGEPYNGIDENIWTCPTGKIKALAEAVTGEWPSDNEIFSIVADKIDAEMANARRICLDHVASLWVKDNGWPDFREGEDFGAWLDRCALMRPRYDNGDPVDMEDFGDPESDDFAWYTVSDSGDWTIYAHAISPDPIEGDISERVERPAPEVLGADGLPVVKGETVYELSDGTAWQVTELHRSEPRISVVSVGDNGVTRGGWFLASEYTHTPPDTQERIDDDATMPPAAYCAAYGIDLGDDPDREAATTTMVRDLLRRQREYDKRKGGE